MKEWLDAAENSVRRYLLHKDNPAAQGIAARLRKAIRALRAVDALLDELDAGVEGNMLIDAVLLREKIEEHLR